MPRRYPVTLAGAAVTLERPWRPRLLRDGVELPRDPDGDYRLELHGGRVVAVSLGQDWRQVLAPVATVDGVRHLLVRRLSRWARVPVLLVLLVGSRGGALGALLAALAIGLALPRLWDPERRPHDSVVAYGGMAAITAAPYALVALLR